MNPLAPIYTAELFAPLNRALVQLLRGLAPAEWDRPTVAGPWTVRDVAAHLLDGDWRKLAFCRDGHTIEPPQPIRGYDDLVRFINHLNATGVAHGRRFSPDLLVDLLETSGRWIEAYVLALRPHETALHAVAWAGEDRSENWMDIGREYTERWHHQMQIRDALGAAGLIGERWMKPLLDLSVRALPRAYAGAPAPDGTAVTLDISGEGGATWSLVRAGDVWRLFEGRPERPSAEIRLAATDAWRLFYHGLSQDEARRRMAATGDPALVAPLARVRSVMV